MKKFWYVQSKNYDQMNSLVGSDLSDKEFDIAEGDCIKAGFEEIVNPANLPRPETWKIALKRDLRILSECDSIYMLNDWKESKGARLEYWYAKRYGLTIYYEGR